MSKPRTLRGYLLRDLRAKVARAEQAVVGAAVAAHARGWDMEDTDLLDRAVRRLVKARRTLVRERSTR